MTSERFDARLDTVPQDPGVYLMKDASGCIIYVGKAKKLRNRLKSYFASGNIPHPKVRAMVSHVADFEYTVVGSEAEALLLEANLIKRYQPKYNILLRDDKGYPYICITLNEEYPRVFKSFRIDEDLRKAGALYYGPYMNSDLYQVLKTIENLFPLKRCHKVFPRDIGKDRPCLNYHIGKCMAPCQGEVSAADYRRMINRILMFLEGSYDGIENAIRQEMEDASENLEFEKAAALRDRLASLAGIRRSQHVFMEIKRDVDAIGLYSDAGETCVRKLEVRDGRVVGSSTYFVAGTGDEAAEVLTGFITQYYDKAPKVPGLIVIPEGILDEDAAKELEVYLSGLEGHRIELREPKRGELRDLSQMAMNNAREMMVRRILRGGGAGSDPQAPVRYLETLMGVAEGTVHRVESYDISNLGNDDICSGMVVFRDGKPEKNSYRLFRMKRVVSQDDFASMRETLSRRFAHNEKDGFTLPDLILVDGGKGQLSAVAGVVRSIPGTDGILLAGMVKNDRHRTSGIVFEDGREISLERKDMTDEEISLLRFLTAVQNEVHRFAVSYQRKLSGKRNMRYRLENIPGIGPAKRKLLLAHFGTIKAIENASVEDLVRVKGISAGDAEAIRKFFGEGQ
ncbi:Excinuclease ABC subunit C [Ruminococcaceae bacterium YRB3002]|nr:Excinuclease ABC subunit C [Ruminococcaceae bacterium YRB3002]